MNCKTRQTGIDAANQRTLSPEEINSRIKFYDEFPNIIKVYSEIIFYSGFVKSFGSELDAPEFGNLEILLDVKKKASLLPSEITELAVFKEHMGNIDEGIRYCGGTDEMLKEAAKVVDSYLKDLDKPLDIQKTQAKV